MLSTLIKYQKGNAYALLLIFSLNLISTTILAGAEPSPVFYWNNHGRGYHLPQFPGMPFINHGISTTNTDKEEMHGPSAIRDEPGKIDQSQKGDIDGPGQPEMKSFQSVNANNMVDLFTGDFAYGVPLLDVGGYPVNLHYGGGITMDQEASWVGLGWNINPGSISRNMRGMPDDFDGVNDSLTRTQHIKPNKTTGVTIDIAPNIEIVGVPIDISAKLGIFYNTYNGYGLETGVGIGGTGKSSFGSLTGNLSISNNSQEGIRVNPSLSVGIGKNEAENNMHGTLGISTGYSSRAGVSSIQINGGVQFSNQTYQKNIRAGSTDFPSANISFATPAYSPTITMPYTNKAYSFTGKIGGELWGIHGSASFTGYSNEQKIADQDVTQKIPAVGYIYSTNSNGKENVLLDFNREKELEFNYKTTPHIALPQYTYDAYSISGEGIGGSFRPYRGDVGYVFDHSIATRSSSANGSVDIGTGGGFHVGLEITNITTQTANHRWNQNNAIEPKLKFTSPDTTYESVYFRNPGEKTTNAQSYYRSIGDDSLIRIKLSGSKENVSAASAFIKYDHEGKPQSEIAVGNALVKKQRDKRTQVISYLSAQDATILGLDKTIKSYAENSTPMGPCSDSAKEMPRVDNIIRKKNHLSEITVLNSDGRKYYYGLPIYNTIQKDVTFAIDKVTNTDDSARGLVGYNPGTDNSTGNRKGKDNYFSRDEMPPYAHNFLLTGIVSPDYVDITGNGISEDDPGDAIKFNYTEVYGLNQGNFSWRTPFAENKANYNEGLKTYNRDDKATYLYGKKEIWYLNSIESKTMIAVFRLANDRKDAYAVMGENGGADSTKASRRLDHIDLYVKADLIKNGIARARPVKTVHFSYDYELCKGSNRFADSGKLTLKSVWFTYNKNNKGKLNPYVFSYHPDNNGIAQSGYNPSFNSRQSDRWGVYKDAASNPGNLNNADFPYSIQDSAVSTKNASMWNLTDITLPSGGKMHITYESDDYAFVQNRRATQMTTIAGINASSADKLYNVNAISRADYDTIYINTSDALRNKQDIHTKYLSIDDVLYFKIAVKMPSDQFGSGVEMVPGYASIADYGISAGNNHQFWIRLATVEGKSPLTRAALQFLRLNLKSKAYPGSEGVDDLDIASFIKLMATSGLELQNMVKGFDSAAKAKYYCSSIDLSKSFIRLSNPNFKKYGGGYRVKRIEIYDNWKHMTNQKESVYGQEYNYTTTESVNGKPVTISSGVATYEPGIGAEENPFRRPVSYIEKLAPMGPVNYMFSEEPIGETFFGAPMIGYSKVKVRTINTKTRSANGWEETEYYTSRDFPTIVEHTLLEEGSSKFKYETKSNFLRLNHKNYVTLSQGFRIELNDMNGKMKAQSTYAENDSLHPIKYSLNFYRVDDDKAAMKHLNNEVWVVDSVNGHINQQGQVGKDIEVMVDLREQHSQSNTRGFSPNLDLISPFLPPFVPVLPLPSLVNLPQKEDVKYRSAAVVKVVQRYGMLDSVVVMDKGSVVSTKNILYDGETGNVLLSRTNNDFNDPVYNFNYPAYWAYSGMDLAYKNLGAIFQSPTGLQLNQGILYKEGGITPYPATRFFESGDEVYVYDASRATQGTDCRRLTVGNPGTPWSGKLWAISAAKGSNTNDSRIYFIDSLGRVARDMVIRKMVIIRSGKRNMVDVSAGSMVMLTNPMKQMPDGSEKIVIDSSNKVLNASVATFKDLWKLENSQYEEDSCYTVTRTTVQTFLPLPLQFKTGNSAALFRQAVYTKTSKILSNLPVRNIYSASYSSSNTVVNTSSFLLRRAYRYYLKSLVQFDLTSRLYSTDSIASAIMYLYPQAPATVWDSSNFNNVAFFHQKQRAHYEHGDIHTLTNVSKIQQVIAPWDLSTTSFDNIVTASTSATVARADDATCVTRTADVTSMARDMLKHPSRNQGFLLSLNNITGDLGEINSSERTLGFAADWSGSPVSPNCLADTSVMLVLTCVQQKDTCVKLCRKNIVDSATNPYRWGALGNWRMERSYVYYNARQENNATIKTSNIRQEGTLKAFIPYWSFGSAGITGSTDTTRWVWNSAISNFNKKGFEIENYDALGRYNSGLYGYNQTLPIAVAQNAQYREILFDGFEDYGYKTSYCQTCTPPREVDFLKGNSGVDTTKAQSHTGLYSIKINNGSESVLTVPIDTIGKPAKIIAGLDSTAVYSTQVVGAGTGLTGAYYMGTRLRIRNITTSLCVPGRTGTTRVDPTINFDWSSGPPMTSDCSGSYHVDWTGSIQPRYTDFYVFYFQFNGTASVKIDNTIIYQNGTSQTGTVASSSIFLQKGTIHKITVSYTKTEDVPGGPVILKWASVNQPTETIPVNFFYPSLTPTTSDTLGSIGPAVQYYCYKGKVVKDSFALRPVFSPVRGSMLTVSAWVRLDVADCNATPALDSAIQVTFNTGTNSAWLKKTGLRIEGWQRYEANVKVPSNATTAYLRLKTLSSNNIYVDDIRLQPFNSGMKSFVYNPTNLRLMAELDENNYASFYEYDDDGTLIRVKKETERGIMTVQETRSALLKQ